MIPVTLYTFADGRRFVAMDRERIPPAALAHQPYTGVIETAETRREARELREELITAHGTRDPRRGFNTGDAPAPRTTILGRLWAVITRKEPS